MKVRTCPTCGRAIEVFDGRWTQHTDPETWHIKPRALRQCRMAGLVYVQEAPGPGDGAGRAPRPRKVGT